MLSKLTNVVALGTLVTTASLTSASAAPFPTRILWQPAQVPTQRVYQTSASSQSMEQAVLTQINQYRQSRRLPPLTLDSRITSQAQAHSQAMANGRVPFGHSGFQQRVQVITRSIPYAGAAENVFRGMGSQNPATQAVQSWLKSPGHRKNIEGNYDLTGIGIAHNAKGEYYFTQVFIKRR
ncbi:CAP domain-containing protein [Leptothermofonsia sichuanensis E412]|uniref:CAP domain-containing protein n=1 Tax=Leptothermofonsia sichuanensis TaxID=2917832 RepID=UPI001CA6CEB9|nr:CAP domain-containing protein [Leptothermofonsia sichuanensis]QZZ22128.1 CAP domain-containing protein [Leptothermofonsia sichuanensis E412]